MRRPATPVARRSSDMTVGKAEYAKNDGSIETYSCPKDAWKAMLADCEKAKASIDYEQYIIHDDEAGRAFLKLFARKAKEGVRVRLFLDHIGSRTIVNAPELNDIIAHDGRVGFFNYKRLWHIVMPHTWFPRNHIKTLLIDDTVAYVGSVCINADMAGWRDTQIRITGDGIKDVVREFDHIWSGKRVKRPKPEEGARSHSARYLVHRPRFRDNPIYTELLKRIETAQTRICLASPYFLPPYRLFHALRSAVARGVQVDILIGEHTDVPIADLVTLSYIPHILRAGIRLHLYKPTVMHAKYMVIDDSWASVGSTNLDNLSLRRNREANLILTDPTPVEILADQFQRDLQQCRPGDMAYWHAQGVWRRTAGVMLRVIKKVL